MAKTTDELLKEFLANGGEIQKIPAEPYESSEKISSTAKTPPELKTLAEGELLYGKSRRKNKKKKKKEPDYSGIDMNLIPDHIKKMINYNDKQDEVKPTKEDNLETNKNS